MQETKNAEPCQHMEEAGRRGDMRGRHRRRRAVLMPFMMVVPFCMHAWMHAATGRSLKRIERRLDDLERRPNAVGDTPHRG
jgi:hypothetical protein